MGCDIHGYIETRKYPFSSQWDDCMDIKTVVGRNYGMFSLLFGVRNYAKFVPVAPERGLPKDVSERALKEREAWDEDGHSASYITLQEIKAIDWDEHGTTLADYINCYKPGEKTPFSSFTMSSELSERDYQQLALGETIEKASRISGVVQYRREFAKKSDAKSSDWTLLISIMEQLQSFYEADDERYGRHEDVIESKPAVATYVDTSRVRLVVWFDN